MKTISAEQFQQLYGSQALAAFPSAQQKPGAVSTAFKSGVEQAKSGAMQVGNTSGNPLDLVEGFGNFGAGVINAIFSPLAPVTKPIGKAAEAVADKIADIPAVQNFADSGAGKTVSRVAGDVANYSTIAATVGGGIKVPKLVAGAADAAGAAAANVADATSSVANGAKTVAIGRVPKLLSIFTGEKNAVVESALKNPTAADIGIQGGDTALRGAVEQASKDSLQVRNQFTLAYNKAFERLAGENAGKLIGGKTALYRFADDLKDSSVSIEQGGKLNFVRSLIKSNPGEAAKIQAAYDAIRAWNDWTLSGTDQLKMLVGRLTKFANEAGGSSKSPFLGKFYHYLDTTIADNLPENAAATYRVMNKQFSSGISLYDDVVDAFNSGDPFKRVSQLFGDNNDTLRQIVEFYEKKSGNKVGPVVAGRTLAQERQAAFGFLNPRSWIDFFISPKQQAKVVTQVGKLTK